VLEREIEKCWKDEKGAGEEAWENSNIKEVSRPAS